MSSDDNIEEPVNQFRANDLSCPSCEAPIDHTIQENGELICPLCGCVLEGSQLVSQVDFAESLNEQVGTFVSRAAVAGGWLSSSARAGAPQGVHAMRSSDSEEANTLRRRLQARQNLKHVLRQMEQLHLVGRLRDDDEEQAAAWLWAFVMPRRRMTVYRQQQAAAAVIYLQARQQATQRTALTYLDLVVRCHFDLLSSF
jgi:transcription initiation factor TFIIIB Brf1 subunit/transcription initiation factor TFIIB